MAGWTRRRVGPLRWYPPAWRDRYGEEFLAYIEDTYGRGPLPWSARWSLLAGGLRERARYAGLIGNRVPVTERVRAGVLVVLGAWTAFVVAVLSLAKLSENFQSAAPAVVVGARGPVGLVRVGATAPWIPKAALTLVGVLCGAAVLAVVGAAALAVPAFWRFLRAGGWRAIRRHVVRAGVVTAALVIVTLAMMAWAHHLTWPQRNGQLAIYGAVFVAWAALVATCLILWTAAAVAAARRMDIPWVVLFVQAIVAVGVAVSMVVMVVLTAVWWGSVAVHAPWVLRLPAAAGAPRVVPFLGTRGGAWSPWLVGTVSLMVASAAGGLLGAARIAGLWSTSRREI